MSSSGKKRYGLEVAALGLLLAVLAVSAFLTFKVAQRLAGSDDVKAVRPHSAVPLNIQTLEKITKLAAEPMQAGPEQPGLLAGELRVIAIGSAYPIPYEAEVCPFSNIPQPAMNQLDRDGDGITDDWELAYELNKYDAADALMDLDDDGFSNVEEFRASTNPRDAEVHPPYAEKLRFVDRKDIPFFLVFDGFTELSDGSIVFQLNEPDTGKTHFASLGEVVEGVVLQRFELAENGRSGSLFVMRSSFEIELRRGEVALDPESKAELINILDRTPIIVTMGALLSLHKDEYAVLGVHSDKVILKDTRSGKVFDIVGLADGER